MGDDTKLKYDVINKLFEPQTSTSALIQSFSIFKPSKRNRWKILVVILISIMPSIMISFRQDTISCFADASDAVLNLMLALFGIIFTGYAIFQAILNEKMLIKMIESTIETKSGEESLLQNTNKSFVGLMMLVIVLIAASFLLKVSVGNLPQDFSLFKNKTINECISALLITTYFSYTFTILYEMKCFVFNIAQLFNVYSGARIIEILEQRSEPKNDR